MHEYSIVKREVERILGIAKTKRVNRVVFSLGKLAHGNPESIKAAFTLAATGTSLSNVPLDIVNVEPKVQCLECKAVYACSKNLNLICPECGSALSELIAGEECRVERIEVEE